MANNATVRLGQLQSNVWSNLEIVMLSSMSYLLFVKIHRKKITVSDFVSLVVQTCTNMSGSTKSKYEKMREIQALHQAKQISRITITQDEPAF